MLGHRVRESSSGCDLSHWFRLRGPPRPNRCRQWRSTHRDSGWCFRTCRRSWYACLTRARCRTSIRWLCLRSKGHGERKVHENPHLRRRAQGTHRESWCSSRAANRVPKAPPRIQDNGVGGRLLQAHRLDQVIPFDPEAALDRFAGVIECPSAVIRTDYCATSVFHQNVASSLLPGRP